MATLQETYASSNASGWISLSVDAGAAGQSFTAPNSIELYSVKFWLNREGGATGNAVAKLYSHTGTFGSTGTPNTLLATSDNFDVTAIPDNGFTLSGMAFYEFLFTGAERYAMVATTNYFIVVEFAGANIVVGGDQTSPSHAGTLAYNDGVWNADSGFDLVFEVWGEAIGGGGEVIKDVIGLGVVPFPR